jgi:ComEC/Rec2-related protein
MTLSLKTAVKLLAAFLIILSGTEKLCSYLLWRTPSFAIPKENVRVLTGTVLLDSTPSLYGTVETLIRLEFASDFYGNSATAKGILRLAAKSEALYAGDRVRFFIRSFDEERVRVRETQLLCRPPLSLIRSRVLSFLSSGFPDDTEGVLMKGLILGLPMERDSDVKTLSRESGMAHILALSGLHLAFFSFLFALLVKPVFKEYAPFVSLFPLFFYILAIGPKPSLLRAFLLRTVFVLFKPIKPQPALVLTFFLQASLFPDTMGELSTLYSYLALAGILFLSPVLEYPFKRGRCIVRLFSVSYAAILLTSPISFYVFGEVRTGGLFLSFLTTPILFIIMAKGCLGLFIPSLLKGNGYSSMLLIRLMELGARFPVIKDRKGLLLFFLPLLLIFITSGILFLERKKRNVEPGLRKPKSNHAGLGRGRSYDE